MYSVSYRYNPNTSNPYSVYKQPDPIIHIFYSVYKKRNYLFPYKFGFGFGTSLGLGFRQYKEEEDEPHQNLPERFAM